MENFDKQNSFVLSPVRLTLVFHEIMLKVRETAGNPSAQVCLPLFDHPGTLRHRAEGLQDREQSLQAVDSSGDTRC